MDNRWGFGDGSDWSYLGTIQDDPDVVSNPDLHGGFTAPKDILAYHNMIKKDNTVDLQNYKKDGSLIAENILETRIYKTIQELKVLEKGQ